MAFSELCDLPHPLPAALQALHARHARHFAAELAARLPAAVQGLLADAYNQAETTAAESLQLELLPYLPQVQARFEQELLARLSPTRRLGKARLLDFERLGRTPDEEAAEASAIASLAQSFAEAAGRAQHGCLAHLNIAAQRLGLPGLATALASSAPCAAFMASLAAAGVGLEGRMLALRPLESRGLSLWVAWTTAVSALLDDPAMALPDPAEPTVSVTPLSAAAVASFKAVGQSPDAGTDAQLAEELLRTVAEDGNAATAINAFHDWFDAIKAEAQLPAAFQDDWEGLRFTLNKAALHDTGFFSGGSHPLRSRASALCVDAALSAAQFTSPSAVRSGFRQLAADAAVNAGAVLGRLHAQPALSPQALQAFASACEREARQRLETLLDHIREAALDKLGWQSLPAHCKAFAAAGLAPLLSAAWLRDGRGSAADRTAQALIGQWQDSRRSSTQRLPLRQALRTAWAALGAEAQRVEHLSAALQASWHEGPSAASNDSADPESEIDALLAALDAEEGSAPSPLPTAAVPVAKPAAASELSRLFAHGRWLRVPTATGGARFLSVAGFDAAQSSVLLASATGETALQRPAESLLAEMFDGSAELLSPDAETQSLLASLRQQRQLTAAA